MARYVLPTELTSEAKANRRLYLRGWRHGASGVGDKSLRVPHSDYEAGYRAGRHARISAAWDSLNEYRPRRTQGEPGLDGGES